MTTTAIGKMTKAKLNLQQKKRILQQQQAYCEQVEATGDLQEGLVITHYGSFIEIEDKEHRKVRCSFRRNLGNIVVGDEVIWQWQAGQQEGIILSYRPRCSELCRPDRYGKLKPIAANIDKMLIVMASYPELSEYVIDRYLVAAELIGVQPVILLNKIDLLDSTELQKTLLRLDTYQQLGYQILPISCKLKETTESLQEILMNKTSIFVGPSGVGKSSLVQLLTGEEIRIGKISEALRQGMHTTTAVHLYYLQQGGKVIDSPGIREFGLWHISRQELLKGFIELQARARQCKFRSCQHGQEPECGIQAAVNEGEISKLRLESYQRILASLN